MSWRFLRDGQSGVNAVASLDALLIGLRNVTDYDAAIAANKYLMWAESAETQLRDYFADQSVWRVLHTERFWRIRAITAATLRPHPMIEGELGDQQLALERLRDQLLHYQSMLATDVDERLLLLDTNTLIHGTLFTQVRWNELVAENRARIVIPLIVLDELDGQKNKSNQTAGGVLREIDTLLQQGKALARTPLRANVTLQVVDEPTGHERVGNADDEIVYQAVYYASHAADRITLVTRDRAMRVRAEAAGLAALMLPPTLYRSKD